MARPMRWRGAGLAGARTEVKGLRATVGRLRGHQVTPWLLDEGKHLAFFVRQVFQHDSGQVLNGGRQLTSAAQRGVDACEGGRDLLVLCHHGVDRG